MDVRRFQIRYRTQIIRHVLGWRLHTLEDIPAGSFVLEYVSEILSPSQLHAREFDYGYQPMDRAKFILTLKQRPNKQQLHHHEQNEEEKKRTKVIENIAFDASRFGNASSFIRSVCGGSLRFVLLHASARHVPRLLLLAARDIKRGEELTIEHDAIECIKHAMQLQPYCRRTIHVA